MAFFANEIVLFTHQSIFVYYWFLFDIRAVIHTLKRFRINFHSNVHYTECIYICNIVHLQGTHLIIVLSVISLFLIRN